MNNLRKPRRWSAGADSLSLPEAQLKRKSRAMQISDTTSPAHASITGDAQAREPQS
jgi:hypothetical protein